MRASHLEPRYVDVIPDRPDEGILYICEKYHTATHRCCCGCGKEVVTPLLPAAWRLQKKGGKVSLYPSIGNWNFPCRSHYWIVSNRIQWARAMSAGQIQNVEARDRAHLSQYVAASNRERALQNDASAWSFWKWVANILRKLFGCEK